MKADTTMENIDETEHVDQDYRMVIVTAVIGLFILRAIWRYLSSPSIRSYFRGPSKEVKHYRREIFKLRHRLKMANEAISTKTSPYAKEIKNLLRFACTF